MDKEKIRRLEAAISSASVSPADDVLNVGVGSGELFRRLANGSGRRVGVDFSREMIDAARKRSDADYVSGAVQRLSFASGTFDVVFCLGVVGYLPNGAFSDAAAELSRILASDGTLLLSFANQHSPFRQFRQFYYEAMETGKRLTGLGQSAEFEYKTYTPDRVISTLQNEGLEVSVDRYLTFSTGIWNTAVQRRLYQVLEHKFDQSSTAGSLAMTWLLRAEKPAAEPAPGVAGK